MGFSHELVEMITDPETNPRPAWEMNRDFLGQYEIGDACNPLQDRLDGVEVAAYWSNVDKACVIPGADQLSIRQAQNNHGGERTSGCGHYPNAARLRA
jgi:hypothetical protein